MRRRSFVALLLLVLVMSVGCSTATKVVPEGTTPGEQDMAVVAFTVISSTTTSLGRQIWLVYVDGFKDDSSVWSQIRIHGQKIAAQSQARSSVAVVVYFFDEPSDLLAPTTVDAYWARPVEDELPHCVASVETWTTRKVVAVKYPFYESKAGSL